MPGSDRASGGRRITVDAPYDRMPLYVRAGSIVPMGPDAEWTGPVKTEDIVLYVYGGADADFTLYEDDGVSYAYERGEYTKVHVHWDDKAQKLTTDGPEYRWILIN